MNQVSNFFLIRRAAGYDNVYIEQYSQQYKEEESGFQTKLRYKEIKDIMEAARGKIIG